MIDDTRDPESYSIEIEYFVFDFNKYEIIVLSSLMQSLKDIDTSKCVNSITERYLSKDFWLGVQDVVLDRDFLKLDVADTVNFYNLCELAFAIFDEERPEYVLGISYYESLREKLEKSKSVQKNVCIYTDLDMRDSQTKKLWGADRWGANRLQRKT